VEQTLRRLHRSEAEVDLHGVPLAGPDEGASGLNAKRFLSLVATTSSSCPRVICFPARAAADSSSSTATHPFGSTAIPIVPGSWRSTRLRNLLRRTSRGSIEITLRQCDVAYKAATHSHSWPTECRFSFSGYRQYLTRPSRNQTSSGKTDRVCSPGSGSRCFGVLGGHGEGRIDGKVCGANSRGSVLL
jgi:hypothetical protein